MQHPRRHSKLGLTLIEILIALALLGILVSFVVSSLAGSFQITRENRKSLDATTTAQRVIEDIRGQWNGSRAVYNTGCATLTLQPPNATYMTLSAKSSTLDATATTAGTAGDVTACGTLSTVTTCVSAMKRVVVTAVDSSNTTRILARVTLDVVCP